MLRGALYVYVRLVARVHTRHTSVTSKMRIEMTSSRIVTRP